jgi:hypothetical protein
MTDEDKFVSYELIKVIKSFPIQREIKHCDSTFTTSPFDFYAVCPECKVRMKVWSFSGVAELEDAFDAVFEWVAHPKAKEHFEKRQKEIIEDTDKDSVS